MQKNAEKCREMKRNVEKYREMYRNVEKSSEMQKMQKCGSCYIRYQYVGEGLKQAPEAGGGARETGKTVPKSDDLEAQ